MELKFKHIKLSAQIIDAAVQRGAFNASELREVSEAYEALSDFITHVEANKSQEETTQNTDNNKPQGN